MTTDAERALEERMLLARAKPDSFEGIEDITREIVQLYHQGLLRYARSCVHTREDAEDIVGDLYAKLPTVVTQFTGGNPGKYLNACVRNAAISLSRKPHYRYTFTMVPDLVAPPVANEDRIAAVFRIVSVAAEALSPKLRADYLDRVLNQYTETEIADRDKKEKSTVRSHVSDGNAHIRKVCRKQIDNIIY